GAYFGSSSTAFAEGRKRKLVPLGRTAHDEVPAEQDLGVRVRVGGGPLERRGLFGEELHLQRRHHRARDLVLHRKHLGELAIVSVEAICIAAFGNILLARRRS